MQTQDINISAQWIVIFNITFRIVQVQAKSHQDYPISFRLSTESDSQSVDFAINSESGVVDLLRRLDYEKDPAQYHLRALAIENGRPSRTSTVSVSTGNTRPALVQLV